MLQNLQCFAEHHLTLITKVSKEELFFCKVGSLFPWLRFKWFIFPTVRESGFVSSGNQNFKISDSKKSNVWINSFSGDE